MQLGEPCTLQHKIDQSSAFIVIQRPDDYALWPLLHEPEQPGYLTQGISQGAVLWPEEIHGDLSNPSGDRTGATGSKFRVQERGLVVKGLVVSAVTAVRIHILDAAKGAIPLKTSPDAAIATEIKVVPGAAEGSAGMRTFEAVIYLDRPATHFGPVEVHARAIGVPQPAEAVSHALLVGVQIALVDDRATNVNGQQRGPLQTEAHEQFVIDFLSSPQSTLDSLSAQTRARRMIVYQMSHRSRLVTTMIPPVSMTLPEMPLWMAELHLVGVNDATLAAFLLSRGSENWWRGLQLTAQWQLETSWDGPNSGSTTRPYRYRQEWTASSTARLVANPIWPSVGGANTPDKAAVAFPVAKRRAPQVVTSGVTRPWGRRGSAALLPTILIEFQPNIVHEGREILRGGDGELKLISLRIDGRPIDPGRISAVPVPVVPPANTPVAMLPTFRVKGLNLPETDRRPLLDGLVTQYVQSHAADAWVTMLPLAVWQETMWRVLDHESIGGSHFERRGSGRYKYLGQYFGCEQDMPIFGAPAGYGWGQLDVPAVTNDAAWSFAENARAAIALLLGAKARAAHTSMSPHFADPLVRTDKAAFRREVVRRYNGNTEFRWSGTGWEIYPSSAQRDNKGNPNPQLLYPNAVLGTNVPYWTGQGPAATFPWPIAFTTAQYGPGI